MYQAAPPPRRGERGRCWARRGRPARARPPPPPRLPCARCVRFRRDPPPARPARTPRRSLPGRGWPPGPGRTPSSRARARRLTSGEASASSFRSVSFLCSRGAGHTGRTPAAPLVGSRRSMRPGTVLEISAEHGFGGLGACTRYTARGQAMRGRRAIPEATKTRKRAPPERARRVLEGQSPGARLETRLPLSGSAGLVQTDISARQAGAPITDTVTQRDIERISIGRGRLAAGGIACAHGGLIGGRAEMKHLEAGLIPGVHVGVALPFCLLRSRSALYARVRTLPCQS